MKNVWSIMALLWLHWGLQAQTLTLGYKNSMPRLPVDSCNISRGALQQHTASVGAMVVLVEGDIRRLNGLAKQQVKLDEAQAKEKAMAQMKQQYGLSEGEMDKMKSGKMSDADKKAMAEKMLQQQANMSMDEVKNLQQMSDAGRKAYSEALAAEHMANAQSGAAATPVDQDASNLFQLMQEQQSLQDRTNEESQRIAYLFNSIESNPNLMASLQNIEKWQSGISANTGADGGQSQTLDSLSQQIKNTKSEICATYTPMYRSALRQYEQSLQTSLADLYRLGQTTARLTQLQTTIQLPSECAETGCLQLLKDYLEKLQQAYKYKLYFAD